MIYLLKHLALTIICISTFWSHSRANPEDISHSNFIPKPKILVTGGMGYIGSHVSLVLLEAGYEVVIVDNLSNSNIRVLERIEKISQGKVSQFYQCDMSISGCVEPIFQDHKISGVIHLAGLKAVGESVARPLTYFHNNLYASINLLRSMEDAGVKALIFSSSATVYGNPKYLPLDEQHDLSVTNPYGRTKLQIENILMDLAHSSKDWNLISLRYFNPIGAHPSGLIGEDPLGIPNNLLPYIIRVISGKLPSLSIYGNDYDTKDGTGVRDYIHVMDLAEGHLAALKYLEKNNKTSFLPINLGTGEGYSVLDIINAFKANGVIVPFKYAPRRDGDIASSYADATKAKQLLGWSTKRDLNDMIKDSLTWANKNPNGYRDR